MLARSREPRDPDFASTSLLTHTASFTNAQRTRMPFLRTPAQLLCVLVLVCIRRCSPARASSPRCSSQQQLLSSSRSLTLVRSPLRYARRCTRPCRPCLTAVLRVAALHTRRKQRMWPARVLTCPLLSLSLVPATCRGARVSPGRACPICRRICLLCVRCVRQKPIVVAVSDACGNCGVKVRAGSGDA